MRLSNYHIKLSKWALLLVLVMLITGVAFSSTKITVWDDDDIFKKNVSGNQMLLPNGDTLLVEDGTDFVYE